jgi:hypothetical protein
MIAYGFKLLLEYVEAGALICIRFGESLHLGHIQMRAWQDTLALSLYHRFCIFTLCSPVAHLRSPTFGFFLERRLRLLFQLSC